MEMLGKKKNWRFYFKYPDDLVPTETLLILINNTTTRTAKKSSYDVERQCDDES